MPPPALEPLPPFDYPDESIESAAEQLLDHSSQLKLLTRRVSQISERQEATHNNMLKLALNVGRIADGQTVCNSLMDLFNRRMVKLMKKLKVDDVEGAEEALKKLT